MTQASLFDDDPPPNATRLAEKAQDESKAAVTPVPPQPTAQQGESWGESLIYLFSWGR